MTRRQWLTGVSTAGLGGIVFLVLAANGVLRHPATATEQTQPVEFFAIGGGFLLLTAGALVATAAYIEPSLDGSDA